MFAVMRDNKGIIKYSCLKPIITVNNENKTEFEGRDLKSLLNSSCVLDFANNTFTKVEDALTYIF